MKNLNKIYLVDDDDATNFIHSIQIKNGNICSQTSIFENGEIALNHIMSNPENELFDLLFLDINMPVMNGWEFLEAYEIFNLERGKKSKGKIVVLTTSINPDDKNKAKEMKSVAKFETKPLSLEKLEDIVNELF